MKFFGRKKNKAIPTKSSSGGRSGPTTTRQEQAQQQQYQRLTTTATTGSNSSTNPPSHNNSKTTVVKYVGETKHVTTNTMDALGRQVSQTQVIQLTAEEMEELGIVVPKTKIMMKTAPTSSTAGNNGTGADESQRLSLDYGDEQSMAGWSMAGYSVGNFSDILPPPSFKDAAAAKAHHQERHQGGGSATPTTGTLLKSYQPPPSSTNMMVTPVQEQSDDDSSYENDFDVDVDADDHHNEMDGQSNSICDEISLEERQYQKQRKNEQGSQKQQHQRQQQQQQQQQELAVSSAVASTGSNPPPSSSSGTLASVVDAQSEVALSSSAATEYLVAVEVTRELVKKFISDIWNRGEIELIPIVCHPSLRFNGHVGMDRVGHEGFARMVCTVRESLSEYHCEIHSMVVESTKAFCRLRFTGKHTGILLGYPPTGKTVAWMGASEFTCKNGQILKVWELGDLKSLEEQLRSDNHHNNK